MTSNERLNKLIEFPGWGNPENAIWFIGIEEAGEWTCCEFYKSRCKELEGISIKEYYEKYYENDVNTALAENYSPQSDGNIYFRQFDPKEKSNATYLGISKFFCEIERRADSRNYLLQELCKKSSSLNSFLTNLNPLGVKNIKEDHWNQVLDDYNKIFGIKKKSKSEYEDEMIKKRKSVFQNLYDRINLKPKIIIGFGYDKGKDYLHLLLLRTLLRDNSIMFEKYEWKKVNASSSLIIKKFDQFLYILLPHLSIDRIEYFKSIKTDHGLLNLFDVIRNRLTV